ncbi:MAG: PTS system mannose/fructose/sorbose family transporter subunit IID [Erysipelotrichaceae bacterium]|nr:PTS system mannose/fructose/sorbose family transporter subunit IID [Erysipelotrichaceae bacterium]
MANNNLTAQEKQTLNKMFWLSHLVFISFSMVKMEANGFTMTMEPALNELYKDDPEEMKEAVLRHQSFFNTHAVPFSFVAGLAYAMERQHKEGKVDGATIENIKAALMGPTAGMFDSLFFNCIRVIAAGISISLCKTGNFFGVILFILLYGVSQSVVKYLLLNAGFTLGTSFIDQVFSSGLIQVLTKCASVLGLMMVGAMTAQMVNVPLNLVINTTGVEGSGVNLGDIINQVFPGLLGVICLFVMVRLIKKGWKPTQLILLIFAIALVGAAIGAF